MGACGSSEDIFAFVKDIGAFAVQSGGIPACKVPGGNGDLHFFAISRGNFYLFGVEEVYGGLFYLVLLVVFGVGPAHIQLRKEVAVLFAVVGHPYGRGDVARLLIIDYHVKDLLGVVQIREALAEGEHDFVCVVPRLADFRRTYGSRGVGAFGVCHRIEVAGLIVLIAHIYALCLYDVVVCVVVGV